jgi:hypothetical protein
MKNVKIDRVVMSAGAGIGIMDAVVEAACHALTNWCVVELNFKDDKYVIDPSMLMDGIMKGKEKRA